MTSIFSSTYDSRYDFFIPLAAWAWNKIGVNPICIMPTSSAEKELNKLLLISEFGVHSNLKIHHFDAPIEKQPTYCQVARLFGSSISGVSKNEVLVTTDVDMLVFKNIFDGSNGALFNLGFDLVPSSQLPICYTWGESWHWAVRFSTNGKTLQECLDEKLGNENCDNMRGNLWSRDQELLKNAFAANNYDSTIRIPRAMPNTQFATKRIDRDDAYWEERLTPDIIDAHLWRPGFTDENFEKIIKLLTYFYPYENFEWLIDYRLKYCQLL